MKAITTRMVIVTKEMIADSGTMIVHTVDTAAGDMTAPTGMETIMIGITPMATIGTGGITEITTTTMATAGRRSVALFSR
jgi:hypothetical protein